MSTTTSDLQLFKYDTSTDGKEVFSISSALNANWDKIDSFASAIKSLSNLSTEGEKRFTDLENSIANKLEADVLLAENGYIKFNSLLICFGRVNHTTSAGSNIVTNITFPLTYITCCHVLLTNFRNKNTTWDYDIHYSDAYRTISLNQISVKCAGLNNGQYIDGFNWITIGY